MLTLTLTRTRTRTLTLPLTRRVMVPQILGYGSKKGFFNDGTPYVPNMKQPIPPKNFEWVDP